MGEWCWFVCCGRDAGSRRTVNFSILLVIPGKGFCGNGGSRGGGSGSKRVGAVYRLGERPQITLQVRQSGALRGQPACGRAEQRGGCHGWQPATGVEADRLGPFPRCVPVGGAVAWRCGGLRSGPAAGQLIVTRVLSGGFALRVVSLPACSGPHQTAATHLVAGLKLAAGSNHQQGCCHDAVASVGGAAPPVPNILGQAVVCPHQLRPSTHGRLKLLRRLCSIYVKLNHTESQVRFAKNAFLRIYGVSSPDVRMV